MAAATTVAATSGTAASNRTTRASTSTGVQLTRSKVNGRFLSTRPPPTETARLHPATIRVSATAAYRILSNVVARASRICSSSPNVRGGVGAAPWPPPTCGGARTAGEVRTRPSAVGPFTLTRTVCSGSAVRFPVYGLEAESTIGLVLEIGLSPESELSLGCTAWSPGRPCPSAPIAPQLPQLPAPEPPQ